MSSPFIRRHQLGVKLRNLREAKGLTHEDIAAHLHQDRAKVSRLENGHIRPDAAEVMHILGILEVQEPEWRKVMDLAGQAAEKGWWDRFGRSMGERQRVYADLESGAESICEYQPGVLPGLLQTELYMWELLERSRDEGPIDFVPERMIKARLRRQEAVFRQDGPRFEAILDEVGLRRYYCSTEAYVPQLHHIVTLVESHPRVSLRILPLSTEPTTSLIPRAPMSIYVFPGPKDPTVVVEPTVTTDHITMQPKEVARALKRYEYARSAALSEVSSLSFLSSLADEISDTAGSSA